MLLMYFVLTKLSGKKKRKKKKLWQCFSLRDLRLQIVAITD